VIHSSPQGAHWSAGVSELEREEERQILSLGTQVGEKDEVVLKPSGEVDFFYNDQLLRKLGIIWWFEVNYTAS
jgi:hypothetical protein